MSDIEEKLWKNQINDYLLQLDAVKCFFEEILKVKLPKLIEFQERLQNGVYLAQLAATISCCSTYRIYDANQKVYDGRGIQYKHVNNINEFLKVMKEIGLPSIFLPEVTDIFEKKNIPKLVYCLRALMDHLRSDISVKRHRFSDDLVNATALQFEGLDLNLFGSDLCSNTMDSSALIEEIEAALLHHSFERLILALRKLADCKPELPYIDDAVPLYFEELVLERDKKKGPFTEDEIFQMIKMQSDVFEVSHSTMRGDIDQFKKCILYNDFLRSIVKEENTEEYYSKIRGIVCAKTVTSLFNPYLTHADVVDIIIAVNMESLHRECCAIRIQRWWRKFNNNSQRRTLRDKKRAAIKLQSAWRGIVVRRDLHQFRVQPTYLLMKKYYSIIQSNLKSYEKERELQSLKASIVEKISYCKKLQTAVMALDSDIALLIRNKTSVQMTTNNLNKNLRKKENTAEQPSNALSGKCQSLLNDIQGLFYFIQTNPSHLQQILCSVHNNEKSKIMDILFAVYNYGTTRREEYYLLKLFEDALKEEIFTKFGDINDIDKPNSAVLNVVLKYMKQEVKMHQFKKIIGQIISNIMKEKEKLLFIPLDIFNSLKNSQKVETPHYVRSDRDALRVSVVKQTFHYNLSSIKQYIKDIIVALIDNLEVIPFGIRYLFSVLFLALKTKFNLSDRVTAKVLSKFFCHQILNPLIISPDVFGIITHTINNQMQPEQRCNLGIVAKLLQNVANHHGFVEPYLQPLNKFITINAGLIYDFMGRLASYPCLDYEFKMTIYGEINLTSEPVIILTPQIVFNLFKFLMTYIDPKDLAQFSDVLNEFQPHLNEPEDLLGTKLFRLMKIMYTDQRFRIVCRNKNKNAGPEVSDIEKLFISAKELFVYLLPYLSGVTLPQALLVPSNSEESKAFLENHEHLPSQHKTCASLAQAKRRLKNMLNKLEEQDYITKDDGYQNLLAAVSSDIIQQNSFKKVQQMELRDVKKTISVVDEQTKELEQKLTLYRQYLDSCMRNQVVGGRTLHGRPLGDESKTTKSKKSLKYTADELRAKGILISITDIPESYYSKIIIEIIPQETPGYFLLTGHFMSLKLEQISFDLRILLNLQEDNVGEIIFFENVKLDVKKLTELINKKFHS